MRNLKTFEMFNGGEYEEIVPATIDEIKDISSKVASAFAIVDGAKVFPHDIEEGSFELNINDEDYAASFSALDGVIKLVSAPEKPIVGNYNDDIETMVNNIKNISGNNDKEI